MELDPLSTVTQGNLARVLFCAGKLDEADAVARKGAELQPTGAASHRWQVSIAAQRGDGEAALREAQLEPDAGFRRFELAIAHYVRGDRPAADAALADLIAKDREGFAYQIAEVYAVRGEADKAFEWLQISFDDRDAGMLSLLVDPLLRDLRGDPRCKDLLEKVGLPVRYEYWLDLRPTGYPSAVLRLDRFQDRCAPSRPFKNSARKSRNNFTTDLRITRVATRPKLGLNESRSRRAESGFASVIREPFS